MNSEGSQYPDEQQCEQCHQKGDIFVTLACRHSFCLRCAAFTYHKFKLAMTKPSITRCIRCDRCSELSEDNIRTINEFTNQVLVPLMREEDDKRSAKNRVDQMTYNELSAGNKQFKSHEQSVEKATPIGRGFYSKCQSPKSGISQNFCQVHPEQQLSIVCLNCQNMLLCISCITNKRHSNHNIKTIAKGIQSLTEQIALTRLKGKQNVDELQIQRRRLDDRRIVIQERWDRTTNSVKLHFSNLIEIINKKCEQVLNDYGQFYQKMMQAAVRDGAKVQQAIKITRRQMEKLSQVVKSPTNSIDLIRKSTHLMEQIRSTRNLDIELREMPICDSDQLMRELVNFSEMIQRINVHHLHQFKGHCIESSKSEQKLKENFGKRIKTNMMSLNSSRDRKDKKCTKTEEDEKRNKSKANYKTESSSKLLKVNKALPAYLLQNKDPHIPQFLADFGPLQSSFKSTSKMLSKSHLPSGTDQIKKKREHVALIKQRLQRKTVNGQSKQMRGTAQGMKKKKIPL